MRYLRCFFATTAIVSAVTLATAAGVLADEIQSHETCGEFGTSIEFLDSPADAAKQALKDEKLVFVLHVSGNFETPDYT